MCWKCTKNPVRFMNWYLNIWELIVSTNKYVLNLKQYYKRCDVTAGPLPYRTDWQHIFICIFIGDIVHGTCINGNFKTCLSILVFHDMHFCQIIWQIYSYTEQNQFHQKLHLVGLNPQPLDHHSYALPTELGRNLLSRRFLKWALFVSCTTSHVGLHF